MRQTLDAPAKPRAALRALLRQRPVRYLLRATGAYLGAFALGCLSAGSRTLPLAGCLCGCLSGTAAVAAVLGALSGYFSMFPFLDALEPAAAAVMLYALAAIVRQSDLPQTPRTLPFLSFCATCSVGLIYSVGAGGAALVWLLMRCVLAVGATAWMQRAALRFHPLPAARPERLNQAAESLRFAGKLLRQEPSGEAPGGIAALYDAVSDELCLRCPGYHSCWEMAAEQTYHALQDAAACFLPRGKAAAADFPQAFTARCRHLDGFVQAVNAQLDAQRHTLQASRRLTEYRTVLAQHYALLARLVAGRRPETARGTPRFRPELGVRALGRRGSRISGDRGACFTQSGMLYLLLCDGMGTGEAAAQEAKSAITLLGSLLRAGALPDEALKLLSGIYILRGDGLFSTVDLLVLDLASGVGTLYKWGAAPSYLLRGKTVKKIGTATPPPGVGTQEEDRPERLRLSLQRGEKLVLVSDGVSGVRTEACLAALAAEEPQVIASEIVAQHAEDGEDDMSAVVLRLHPDETFESVS